MNYGDKRGKTGMKFTWREIKFGNENMKFEV